MARRNGVALFGVGRAGTIHLVNLLHNERAVIHYIVERDLTKARDIILKYRMKDTVAIHCDDAGKVYQDDRSISFLRESNQSRREWNRRCDPSILQPRNRVLAGEVGKVHIVKTCSRDHPLNPESHIKSSVAYAHIDVIRSLNDVDTVVIAMKFRDGTLATIDLSRCAVYGYDQRLEVFGSNGKLMSENQRPTAQTSLTATGTRRDVIKYSFPQRYAECYVGAMQHFLDAVEDRRRM